MGAMTDIFTELSQESLSALPRVALLSGDGGERAPDGGEPLLRSWGYRAARVRLARTEEALGTRGLAPALFTRLAIRRDCLAAFLGGHTATHRLSHRVGHSLLAGSLSAEEGRYYRRLLAPVVALFDAAAERQLELSPSGPQPPLPRRVQIEREVEVSVWGTFRSGDEAFQQRRAEVQSLSQVTRGEELFRLAVERSVLRALEDGIRGVTRAIDHTERRLLAGTDPGRPDLRPRRAVLNHMLPVLEVANLPFPVEG